MTPSTLEEEILKALELTSPGIPDLKAYAKAAFLIARERIEKACHDLYQIGVAAGVDAEKSKDYNYLGSHTPTKEWLKENIT